MKMVMKVYQSLLMILVLLGTHGLEENIHVISSIEGGHAKLPCDIHSRMNDSVYLVLWYRKDSGTPIYSYDSRGDPNDKSLWSEPKAFGSRALYDISSKPSVLDVRDLRGSDSGTYTCRVDYTQSPTVYHHVRLDVKVPPTSLMIIGDRGKEITGEQSIGPFKEGDPFTVLCVATGGEPPPSVLWYMDDHLIDKTFIANEKGAVQNTLTIQRLSRSNMGPLYQCVAANNNMSSPLIKTMTIDIMFPPLGVRIITEDQPVVAGKQYRIGCVTWGSLPPADISWFRKPSAYMGLIPIQAESTNVSTDGNVTESWIRYIPSPEHHRQTITCRSSNYKLLSANSLEDNRILDVFFAPRVELKLGPAVNPRDLEEGDDLYFECHVTAHPQAYKIVWKFNGRELHPRHDIGRIISNQSLVIQKVRKEDSGNYSCQAYNVEGQSESEPALLNVMYKPRCITTQKMIYGVSEGETAYISCQVDSKPKADQILWYMNTTSGNRIIPGAMSTNMAGASLLSYRPSTQMDFGTILCYGVNVVGRQINPCTFHLIPASVPEKPDFCHIANKTGRGIRVVCDPGFNGGLHQTFHMEVIGMSDTRVFANISQDVPSFWVQDLPNNLPVVIRIYASNSKGRSKAETIRSQITSHEGVGYPLKNESEVAKESFSILLILLLGSVILFSVIGLIVGLVMRCLSSPSRQRSCSTTSTLHRSINFQFQSNGSSDGFSSLQPIVEEKAPDSDIYHQRKRQRSGAKEDSKSMCSSDSSGFSEINNSDSDRHMVLNRDHSGDAERTYPVDFRTLGRNREPRLNQYKYRSLQRNKMGFSLLPSSNADQLNILNNSPVILQQSSSSSILPPDQVVQPDLNIFNPALPFKPVHKDNFELNVKNDLFASRNPAPAEDGMDNLMMESDRESCV